MDVKQALETRRAVNFFDPDKPVSEDTVRQLVEMAALTPSSFNLQPWNLIILTDPDTKAELRKHAWDQPKVTDAPVVFIVLADRDGWREDHPTVQKTFEALKEVGQMSDEQRDWFLSACRDLYGRSDEAAQAFACKNTGFFAMSLMIAARQLGLHTHPMDGFDHEAVRKAFDIPENYWIPLLLAVGHFDEGRKLYPPKWRKGFDEIVLRRE
ncbi:MAG: nitroreductase family protein [Desulfatibacillaceae bacterium]